MESHTRWLQESFVFVILYNSIYLCKYRLLYVLCRKRITGSKGRVLAVKLVGAKLYCKMGRAVSLAEVESSLRNFIWKRWENSLCQQEGIIIHVQEKSWTSIEVGVLGSVFAMEMPKIMCTMHGQGLKEISFSVWFWIEINDKIVCWCYTFIMLVWGLLLCAGFRCTMCNNVGILQWCPWTLLLLYSVPCA